MTKEGMKKEERQREGRTKEEETQNLKEGIRQEEC